MPLLLIARLIFAIIVHIKLKECQSMDQRIETLLNKMEQSNMDSIFITSPANVYYITNYYTDPHERLVAVFLSKHSEPVLVLPAMEQEDAKNAGWDYSIIAYLDHENPWKMLAKSITEKETSPTTIGVEFNHLTLDRHVMLQQLLPRTEMMHAEELLANLRVIKNEQEYRRLKTAAELADFGIKTGVEALKDGVTELEIVAKIEYELKKQGVQAMSFATMALSGTKTASPHGNPSMKKVAQGDMVLFDLGGVYEGYCSDITRTVAFKSITEEQERIYNTVLAAEQKAIEAAQVGVAVGKLDQAARDYITASGYGAYFTHRIGHGLGIETHEYPSMHSENTLPLQPNMCFTIEPGVYVPNIGGVRIEDMIYMTDNGAETLTHFSKELIIVD